MEAEDRKPLLEKYLTVVDIWKNFCELHNDLFNLTCDEYSALLGSKVEQIDEIVASKERVVAKINVLERQRQSIINQLNEQNEELQIKNVSSLITFFENFEKGEEQNHLFRFNALLIDIIEKIQAQNKRNRQFINRALFGLKKIREEAMGHKSFTTYTAKGSEESLRSR